MNKKIIISSIAAFAILAAIAGATSPVMAADSTTTDSILGKFRMHQSGEKPADLTDAQKAEMKTKRDAVSAALEAGDYNAWVAAEKAINENSPALKKISANNFSKYSEAYNLQKQAKSILAEIGIDNSDGEFGPCMGGEGRGGHMRFGGRMGFGGQNESSNANSQNSAGND